MPDLRRHRIGVLEGGVSKERDISFTSGEKACLALKRKGFYAEEIDITTDDVLTVKGILLAHNIDAAFIALHGEFGEDGGIQRILEELNIPYTGSGCDASRKAMDKIVSKKLFKDNNIPTPGYFILDKYSTIPEITDFPKVIKPSYSGSSIGVFIVNDAGGLKNAVLQSLKVNGKVIIEDYIKGRELTVGILNDTPLSVVEIIPKSGYFDFVAKYNDGMTAFAAPAPLGEGEYNRAMEIARKAHTALGCRHFSRVDIRMDAQGTPFVLEVNSIPGLTAHSLLPLSAGACGIGFDELIVRMIEPELRDEEKEEQKV